MAALTREVAHMAASLVDMQSSSAYAVKATADAFYHQGAWVVVGGSQQPGFFCLAPTNSPTRFPSRSPTNLTAGITWRPSRPPTHPQPTHRQTHPPPTHTDKLQYRLIGYFGCRNYNSMSFMRLQMTQTYGTTM